MFRAFAPIAAVSFALFAQPVFAQDTDDAKVDALFDALGLPRMLLIMQEEGQEYGVTIGADLFPGGDGAAWAAAVNQIYDAEMMYEEVRGAFGEALEGDDIDAMLMFYTSEPGETIVELEVSARRALLDDAVEAAAKDNAAIARADETPRYLMVRDFVDANDLIESNVTGALNSNYAFYMGLIDGGAAMPGITPDTALQDVWAQEPEIRSSTTEWVFSFLLMAYQPLSDDDMATYLAFSETEPGRDINSALFESFNGMFDDISRSLGLAASRFMVSQEL